MPLRIIVHAAEGNFMLDRDFADGKDALDFARKTGFQIFEIINNYDIKQWEHLDKTIDPKKVMSFMKQKD